MKATQVRYYSDAICIMSYLTFEGVKAPLLYTIENYSKAIPPGNYVCVPYYSEKIAKATGYGNVWRVDGQHNRKGIAYHVANRADQLDGCIAPGLSAGAMKYKDDTIWNAVHTSSQAMRTITDIVGGHLPFDLSIIGEHHV